LNPALYPIPCGKSNYLEIYSIEASYTSIYFF
jgi:hypothetical protein